MKPVCRLEPCPNEWSMLENTQLACPLNANQHAVPAFVLARPREHLTGWKRSSPPPPSVFLLSSFPSPLGISYLCLPFSLPSWASGPSEQPASGLTVLSPSKHAFQRAGFRFSFSVRLCTENPPQKGSHVPLCTPSHVFM